MEFVIAVGLNEIRDVTWRYSSDLIKTLQHRQKCFNETIIQATFDECNTILQRYLPSKTKQDIDERWLGELAEFIRVPQQFVRRPNDAEITGRSSGSLAWRLSRFEIKEEEKLCESYAFVVDSDCKLSTSLPMKIVYNCRKDSYEVFNVMPGSSIQTLANWQSGVFRSVNMMREVERDWNMTYLSRRKTSQFTDKGSLIWRFKLTRFRQFSRIEIKLCGAIYENGLIDAQVKFSSGCSDSTVIYQQPFVVNQVTSIPMDRISADGLVLMDIHVELSGGRGDVAWQHAQLCRTSTLASGGASSGLEVSFYSI